MPYASWIPASAGMTACLCLAMVLNPAENAAAKGGSAASDVDQTLKNIQAIVNSAKNEAAGALTDFQNQLKDIQAPGSEGFMGEQDEEALRASSQALEAKADGELLSGKAEMAGLKIPEAKESETASVRRAYSADARGLALKRQRARLKIAAKKSRKKKFETTAKEPLKTEQKDFLADLTDYQSDAQNMDRLVREVIKHLDAIAPGNEPAGRTAGKLKARSAQLDRDAKDLGREIELLGNSLLLQNH